MGKAVGLSINTRGLLIVPTELIGWIGSTVVGRSMKSCDGRKKYKINNQEVCNYKSNSRPKETSC